MADVVLASLKDVKQFLESLDASAAVPSFVFGGALARMEISIKGNDFHGTITGELARGIAALQDEVYRAANFVLHGLSNKRMSLTLEQKSEFDLLIDVQECCTLLNVDMNKFGESLGKALSEWMRMNPRLIAFVVISVVLIWVSGGVVKDLGGKALDNSRAEAQAKQQIELAKAIADGNIKVLEVAKKKYPESKDVIDRFSEAQENGTEKLVKAVSGAREVRVGGFCFDETALAEIRKRTPGEPSKKLLISCGEFLVYGDTNVDPIKLTLSSDVLADNIVADFDEKKFSAKQIDAVWNAIRHKKPLKMKVVVNLKGREIKGGVIEYVYMDGELPFLEGIDPI